MVNLTDNVEETELDADKRYEQYTREMEYLDKLQIANSGDFCRAIRYFSGFAIPLILTITDISLSKNWAIWVTIGIFLFAILSSIIAHFLSDFGIGKRRSYAGLYWIREKHEYHSMYCHRFFRPLSKPRLCYNTILLKGASDGETQTKNLHARV